MDIHVVDHRKKRPLPTVQPAQYVAIYLLRRSTSHGHVQELQLQQQILNSLAQIGLGNRTDYGTEIFKVKEPAVKTQTARKKPPVGGESRRAIATFAEGFRQCG